MRDTIDVPGVAMVVLRELIRVPRRIACYYKGVVASL